MQLTELVVEYYNSQIWFLIREHYISKKYITII